MLAEFICELAPLRIRIMRAETPDLSQDRVPGLANIPILGHLFKNTNRSNTNEELLIFITPRIVHL